VLYYYAFLDYVFSFIARRNSLMTAAATALEGTAAAYPRGSSSKREDDHL